MLEISLKEFSRNPGKIMEETEDIVVTKRGVGTYFVTRYVQPEAKRGEKGSEVRTLDEGQVRYQKALTEWRKRVGSLDSDGWYEFKVEEWLSRV